MPGKKFDPALRQQAVDMYTTGSTRAEVLDWVEARCGRRPQPSSLSDWVAQARSKVADLPLANVRQFPADSHWPGCGVKIGAFLFRRLKW